VLGLVLLRVAVAFLFCVWTCVGLPPRLGGAVAVRGVGGGLPDRPITLRSRSFHSGCVCCGRPDGLCTANPPPPGRRSVPIAARADPMHVRHGGRGPYPACLTVLCTGDVAVSALSGQWLPATGTPDGAHCVADQWFVDPRYAPIGVGLVRILRVARLKSWRRAASALGWPVVGHPSCFFPRPVVGSSCYNCHGAESGGRRLCGDSNRCYKLACVVQANQGVKWQGDTAPGCRRSLVPRTFRPARSTHKSS